MFTQLNKLRPLFSRRDKLKYAVMLVLMGIGALLEIAGIGAVPAFIATLAAPEELRAVPVAAHVLAALNITTDTELVVVGAVALLCVFAIRAGYVILLSYLQIRMTEHHRLRIARKLFQAYMLAPYEFHLGRNSAELLRNVNDETRNLMTGIINPVLTLTLNGLMALGIVAVLIIATPWSGLVAIAVVGGGSWLFLRAVHGRMHVFGREARTERKRAIQAVNQGLGGLQDARILGVEQALVKVFDETIKRHAVYDRYRQFIGKLANPLLEFIAVLGLVLVVLSMVGAGTELSVMVPMLGLFAAAIVRLRASVGRMLAQASQLSYNMASVDAVVDDLNLLRNQEKARGSGAAVLQLRREISLSNVSYTYPDADKQALNGATLTIRRGQSVGFVGATGSGKTTLVNTVLGLVHPHKGTVMVDGIDIHSNLRGWRNNIGYIPQSIYLLDDTIRSNVAFGDPCDKIDDESVWIALEAAQLADHVRQLPAGLDTYVGELGVRLSGGQRQRIGLARALYRNPEVLIMDEATSALDNETEAEVMRALDALKGDRTLIIIAHRLGTVRDCDCLFFLNDGRVEAHGTFDELCALHGRFKRMAEAA